MLPQESAAERARAETEVWGAGAMGALAVAVVVVGSWYVYQRRSFWDVRASALTAAAEQGLKPGSTFKECASCPEMMVVPAGSFLMGSPASEQGRFDDEGPQRRVTFRQPFAVGKFEVTFDEWYACVAHGGCKQDAFWREDEIFPRRREPVIDVSWNDANQYIAWIAKLTGKPYRLLTEAEWEYAARAAGSGRYAFGDDETQLSDYAWYTGGETQLVGQKKPNAFGVHDMHGNVWEWVMDCYGDYAKAPSDGSATPETSNCSRVLRGGSRFLNPWYLRAALRSRNEPVNRDIRIGFRVARALLPARTLDNARLAL